MVKALSTGTSTLLLCYLMSILIGSSITDGGMTASSTPDKSSSVSFNAPATHLRGHSIT
jgi:hypothetical protein